MSKKNKKYLDQILEILKSTEPVKYITVKKGQTPGQTCYELRNSVK